MPGNFQLVLIPGTEADSLPSRQKGGLFFRNSIWRIRDGSF